MERKISSGRVWTGRILTTLAVLFLLFDSVIKLTGIAPVMEALKRLGYSPDLATTIGALELACIAIYLLRPVAIPGAVLLTGFLGGAVATHVRVGDPLFSHVLFPTYVGALIWIGLYLRDRRLQLLFTPKEAQS